MIAAMMLTIGKYLRKHLHRVLGLASLLWAYPGLVPVAHASDDSGQAPYDQCGFCHEYDGNSLAGNYPKIAGMKRQYLLNQLKDYKFGRRNGGDKMQEAAALLSDKDMQVVIGYFSSQQRTPEPAMLPGVDYRHVQQLATVGDPAREIVACNVCHDSDLAYVPRLAGQHAKYLAQQLIAYKNQSRHNDVAGIMRFLAARLTDTEIQHLSEYLAAGGHQK